MNTKHLKAFFIAVLTLAVSMLSSCANNEDDADETKQENTKQVLEVDQTPTGVGELNKKTVSYKMIPLEIGRYQLSLKWPSSIPKVNIQINELDKGTLSRAEGFEFSVESGSLTRVFLVAMDDVGNEISTYQINLVAPQDLIVDSYYYPESEELKYARIRITEKGVIVTGKKSLRIETPVLQVDLKAVTRTNGLVHEAHIMTYKNAQDGRSEYPSTPGQIEIKVLTKATGTLVINSIGLDGRDGAKGDDAIDSKPGLLDGADAKFEIGFIPGGRGPDRNSPGQCKTRITAPAEKGKDGISGKNGQDGIDGSDSQKFIVNVDGDYRNFNVFMISRPGRGGAGGQKGLSLPPGIGGLKKKILDCQKVVDDGREASGAPVKDALDGQPGANGKVLGFESNLPQNQVYIEDYLPESR